MVMRIVVASHKSSSSCTLSELNCRHNDGLIIADTVRVIKSSVSSSLTLAGI